MGTYPQPPQNVYGPRILNQDIGLLPHRWHTKTSSIREAITAAIARADMKPWELEATSNPPVSWLSWAST